LMANKVVCVVKGRLLHSLYSKYKHYADIICRRVADKYVQR